MVVSPRCSLLVTATAIAALFTAGTVVAAPDAVGQAAPALVVKQLDGATMDLATLRGKVVVLNVWATWCTPCRAEMPMLDAFYRKHEAEGVVLIGLSADDPHDRRDVEKAARGLSYPVAMLQEAKVNGFGNPMALPMTYIIDTNGVVRARLAPTRAGLREEELEAVVLSILSAKTGAGAR